MTLLKPGDRVDCLIKSGIIINAYEALYDEIKTFEIIASDHWGYFIYVPHYYFVKDLTKIDIYLLSQHQIDKRFLNENMIYIKENQIHKVVDLMQGSKCCKCKQFYIGEVSNKWDGTFICYKCSYNPFA
jgi:hypothetical protein